MALSWCCQYRTWVLGLGFTLGTTEVTLAVVFYTFLEEIRQTVGYQVKHDICIDNELYLYLKVIFKIMFAFKIIL